MGRRRKPSSGLMGQIDRGRELEPAPIEFIRFDADGKP
jgi:hypothetical protein